MTAGTYSCLPTQQVLIAGGMIEFNTLAEKLMSIDPSRFRSISNVEDAINNYSPCLENNGDLVSYNKNSKKYSWSGMAHDEREIQAWLYRSVPDMKRWELYPFKTPSNSENCYFNIPWKEIPRDNSEDVLKKEYRKGQNYKCDFRCNGENSCTGNCGISRETIKKYFYVYVGMLEEDDLLERVGKERFEKEFKDVPRRYERKPDDTLI